MHKVLPGINEQDWPEIERKIESVKHFAKEIHIDVIDGIFAPRTTFLDPTPFKKYMQDIFFEVHLMVEEPEHYLEKWSKAGFRRFLGHVEKMSDQVAFVAKAEEVGEVGLALDGKTPLSDITVNFSDLDTLLVMTINAGLSGQEFQPSHLSKVAKIRERDSLLPIEIDGGINPHTLKEGLQAGASRFVSTSFLFGGENPQSRFHELSRVTTDSDEE